MKQQNPNKTQKQTITVLQRMHYGCLAKVFCCKCIHCCQDFDISLLTSNNRKEVFQKMIKRYINKLHKHQEFSVVMDPFFILVALLLGQQSQIYAELMAIITNQSEPTVFSKQDLEFYIPQLCTYLVFHEQLKNMQLQKLLIKACKVDIHFSLKYYFYMKSLEIIKTENELIKYEGVIKYNDKYRTMINHYYSAHRPQRGLTHILKPIKLMEEEHSIVLEKALSDRDDREDISQIEGKENLRSTFGCMAKSNLCIKTKSDLNKEENHQTLTQMSQEDDHNEPKMGLKEKLHINKISFLQQTNIYEPFISKSNNFPKGIFESTVNFFSDLVELGNLLISSTSRKQDLKSYLERVNKRLPATVYIPFTKQNYQDLNIISVVFNESRVFSTKERAPYSICFESFFNPTYNQGVSRDKKIRSVTRLAKDHLRKTHLFEDDNSPKKDQWLKQSQISIKFQKQPSQSEEKDIRSSGKSAGSRDEKQARNSVSKKPLLKRSWSSLFNLKKLRNKILQQKKDEEQDDQEQQEQEWSEKKSQSTAGHVSEELVVSKQEAVNLAQLFGQSSQDQYQRISSASRYSDLPGYKLIHVIIKSHDDLRQECFAMQLLQQFDKIFKMEGLPVKLSPYQVLPLSHDSGIIEFIRDAITIDELKKKGANLSAILTTKAKKKNFINSLVGYSLVTFFLQVKDRHNGNIMIKRDGSLLHIDYGFFMTNMPGKGVQLEKNLPFKLTNEYVDALDGLKSKTFSDFRLLFYQAFNACRKHQHRIIILTKLMYSSYGKTMSCFIKGNESIEQLQQRFNPPGITNDAQISVYCQNLINSSIDNWRSRWYDKWQYYMQGILY